MDHKGERRGVITKHYDREADHKDSFQHVPNCMSEWCHTFQGVCSDLQIVRQRLLNIKG